jgi:hypothetical protein
MCDLAVFHLPDLVYDIAHDYPGGIPALAARMGKSANVLNKQVNPNIDTHKCSIEDLVTILDFADADKRYTHAVCANSGGVFVSTEHLDGISDMALLETYTQLMAKFGEFSKNFHQALSDQRVTKAEIAAIKRDMYALNAAGACLIARLESLVDE